MLAGLEGTRRFRDPAVSAAVGDLFPPAPEERDMLAPDVSPGLRCNKITCPKGATFVLAQGVSHPERT